MSRLQGEPFPENDTIKEEKDESLKVKYLMGHQWILENIQVGDSDRIFNVNYAARYVANDAYAFNINWAYPITDEFEDFITLLNEGTKFKATLTLLTGAGVRAKTKFDLYGTLIEKNFGALSYDGIPQPIIITTVFEKIVGEIKI